MPLFGKRSTPSSPPSRPPPTGITCQYCHETGLHYSSDCPFECKYCGERGHIEYNCAPRCPACYGRGDIRKTKTDVDEDRRPSLRVLVALLQGANETQKRLLKDFEESYGPELTVHKEKMTQAEGRVDNPSPRGSTLEQLEVAIQNVGVWTKMSEQLLGKMAMLDDDK